jgi:hypothetical protein
MTRTKNKSYSGEVTNGRRKVKEGSQEDEYG